METRNFPDGTGVLLPAGAIITFQMHYTSYGKQSSDSSKLGIYFHDTPPKHKLDTTVFINNKIKIPAYSNGHSETATRTVKQDMLLYAMLHLTGYPITMDDVLRHAGGDAVGRPHIADALVEAGSISSRSEAFVDLLSDGGSAYVERERLTATEAIELSLQSGGVNSIAHPFTIDADASTLRAVLDDLHDAGLAGLEAYYSEYQPTVRAQLAAVAAELGLVATGGSDYHGSGKPGLELGSGHGDLVVPAAALEELRLRRP